MQDPLDCHSLLCNVPPGRWTAAQQFHDCDRSPFAGAAPTYSSAPDAPLEYMPDLADAPVVIGTQDNIISPSTPSRAALPAPRSL